MIMNEEGRCKCRTEEDEIASTSSEDRTMSMRVKDADLVKVGAELTLS